jgi:hypothetical protein
LLRYLHYLHGVRRATSRRVDGTGCFLTVERTEPMDGAPWVGEQVVSRFGVFGLASITLDDADPDRPA